MDKNQIENRDQELVNKFRTVVNGKQADKKRKKTRLMWLSAGALACCAILVFVVLRPSAPRRDLTRTAAVNPEVQPPAAAPGTGPEKTAAIAKTETHTVKPATASEKPVPKKPKRTEAKPPVVIAKAVPEKQTPETPPASRKQSVKKIRIARVVTCTGVSHLNYVSPTSTFSMEKDKKPVVWMEVHSEKQKLPYTLKHVYFVNGRKYATVPLNIKYPRMRTWSRITLRHKYQVGKWRVDVVDGNGTLLETTAFTVTP